MGADCIFYTVVGVKLKQRQLYKTHKQRLCNHELPKEPKAKYCPECGERIWTKEWVPLPGWDEDEEWGAFDTIRATEYHDDAMDDAIFVGKALSVADEGKRYDKMDLPDFVELKSQLLLKLKPLGITWDEKDFGIWLVMRWC